MEGNEISKRIWLIADGIPFKLGNMTIRTNDSGKLLVTGWTSTIYFINIIKADILQELNDLKLSFGELLKSYNELNVIVKNNSLIIEYHMAYDDYGKAGIGLCSEIEGKLNWYID
jgi:hypothetical protein